MRSSRWLCLGLVLLLGCGGGPAEVPKEKYEAPTNVKGVGAGSGNGGGGLPKPPDKLPK